MLKLTKRNNDLLSLLIETYGDENEALNYLLDRVFRFGEVKKQLALGAIKKGYSLYWFVHNGVGSPSGDNGLNSVYKQTLSMVDDEKLFPINKRKLLNKTLNFEVEEQ